MSRRSFPFGACRRHFQSVYCPQLLPRLLRVIVFNNYPRSAARLMAGTGRKVQIFAKRYVRNSPRGTNETSRCSGSHRIPASRRRQGSRLSTASLVGQSGVQRPGLAQTRRTRVAMPRAPSPLRNESLARKYELVFVDSGAVAGDLVDEIDPPTRAQDLVSGERA